VIWAAVAIGLVLVVLYLRSRRDPYSLRDLERLQNQLEFESVEEISTDEADEVICPNCFEAYESNRPACPRCGKLK
jgi:uncharacterized paraquat-inducible protein A